MSQQAVLDPPVSAPAVGVKVAVDSEPPRIFDTYAVLYALTLVFLVPGVVSISRLPFRDYTVPYVSLVTLPGLFGLLATLFTDSRDSLKVQLVRAAVLAPLIALTGVTVLFTSSLVVVPISQVLKPSEFGTTTFIAAALLLILAAPLVPAMVRRVGLPLGWRSVVQLLALLFATVVVAGVFVLSLRHDRTLATMERKDVMIYIVGALVWYLPAFGISAGVWRRLGLV